MKKLLLALLIINISSSFAGTTCKEIEQAGVMSMLKPLAISLSKEGYSANAAGRLVQKKLAGSATEKQRYLSANIVASMIEENFKYSTSYTCEILDY
ncbi:hypothetical protein [Vibrio comitans]